IHYRDSSCCQRTPLPPICTLFPYTDALPISNFRAGMAEGKGKTCRNPAAREREALPFSGKYRTCNDLDGRDGPKLQLRQQDLVGDRKSTRLNSSHLGISYAVFCLKKKKQ